jgi:site-specific DNA recombinase
MVYLRYVERAVLDGMREELKDPRLIEVYARSYNEERQRLATNSTSTRAKLEAKRSRIESERQRNIRLVIKRIIGEDDARGRIAELKVQRLQVEAELAALEEAPPVITLHPATLDRYIETVDALAAARIMRELRTTAGLLVASFRALVHSVTIHPNGPREGFEIEVKGKLATLIGGEVFP